MLYFPCNAFREMWAKIGTSLHLFQVRWLFQHTPLHKWTSQRSLSHGENRIYLYFASKSYLFVLLLPLKFLLLLANFRLKRRISKIHTGVYHLLWKSYEFFFRCKQLLFELDLMQNDLNCMLESFFPQKSLNTLLFSWS